MQKRVTIIRGGGAGLKQAPLPPNSTQTCVIKRHPSTALQQQHQHQQQQQLSPSFTDIAKRAAAGVLGAALAATAVIAPPAPPPAAAVTTEQLLFLEAWRAIDKAYVDKGFNGQTWFRVKEEYLKKVPMANREQTYAAIRKLAASLDDPFTRFLEPGRLAALRRGTAGSVTGVGVEVTYAQSGGNGKGSSGKGSSSSSSSSDATKAELAVVAPTPGGPAEAAGLRAGDVIEAVDGTPTAGLSLYEASDLLQGAEGSQVTLRVRSGGSGSGNGKQKAAAAAARDVTLTRRRVEVVPVASALCDGVPGAGKVGYIRLSTFNANTAAASNAAIEDLRGRGAAAYALDLRDNGGGLFPAGVAVARQWLAGGDVVLIADSAGVRDVYSAEPSSSVEPKAPLAVLVNKGTASAAEVLAGALKDNGRARVTGTRTFGKGLIQTVAELSDGSGLAITLARYQTPLGVDINKVGIAPDVALADAPPPGAGSDGGGGDDGGRLPAAGGESVCRWLSSGAAPASLFESKSSG